MRNSPDIFNPDTCPRGCQTHKLTAVMTDKDIPGSRENNSQVSVYFTSLNSQVSKEVTLFGFSSIVASVGGSLGLFVGFSCLDAAMTLVEQVKAMVSAAK